MTATATLARAAVASVASTACTGIDGVHVYDHQPTGKVGPVAVVVEHAGRDLFFDRYSVAVEVNTETFAAAVMADKAEQVAETVDRGLSTGLPSTWQVGTWTFGFDGDAGLFVARCELRLATDDPSPSTTRSVTVGALSMTSTRAAIAAACTTSVASFSPTPAVFDYPTWPGDAPVPVAVVVSPLGIERDVFWHQVAVLVSPQIPADQAQDWLDDLVWQLDDGLRANLSAGFMLAGPGTDEETGWDRVGWLDELDCWAAQVAVGRYRNNY